jgi:hypothetical protein
MISVGPFSSSLLESQKALQHTKTVHYFRLILLAVSEEKKKKKKKKKNDSISCAQEAIPDEQ